MATDAVVERLAALSDDLCRRVEPLCARELVVILGPALGVAVYDVVLNAVWQATRQVPRGVSDEGLIRAAAVMGFSARYQPPAIADCSEQIVQWLRTRGAL